MADIPKNNPMSGGAPCSLYYFPEIPSAIQREPAAGRSPAHFISGAPQHSAAHGHRPNDDSKELSDVSAMVDAAFAKGLEQGRAESAALLREKLESAVSAFNCAVKEMARTHQQNLQRMEAETVRLALGIAKKIIAREVQQNQVIRDVVKMAMEKIADPRHLVLRLNPEDIGAVESIKAELMQVDDGDMTLRIQPDGAILKGGCIIETQLGDIDARIDQQLKMIESMFADQMDKPSMES